MSKYYKIRCALITRQQVINRLRGLSMPWLAQNIGGGPHHLNCCHVWTWSDNPSIESLLPLIIEHDYYRVTAYNSLKDALEDGLTVEVIDHLHSMLE